MRRISKKSYLILAGVGLLVLLGGSGSIYSKTVQGPKPQAAPRMPLTIAHKGSAQTLERAPVSFDHDQHTSALKQKKEADCKICHVLEQKVDLRTRKTVKVFRFPKSSYNPNDKDATMRAYHEACGNCHKEMTGKGKKTGPNIGLCGKCHVRRARIVEVAWAWSPIFNYARHNQHVKALKGAEVEGVKVSVVGPTDVEGDKDRKTCLKCHHVYDEKIKKLVYKKDCENSCGACHKAKDEKTGRALRKVVHAACLGCHLSLAEQRRKEPVGKDKKKFGPITCKGCHGEHKTLTPDEIRKIPRLVRGQKDVLDIVTKDPKAARMKVVAFNHKSHESRTQFCNTCHHHSLEKCTNCHTDKGDSKKGGNVSFERAFHKSGATQSCIGCHEQVKKTRNCAGCHQWLLNPLPKISCPVCHRGSTEGKPVEGSLLPVTFDKEKVPEKEIIKGLEKEFKPAELPHQKIVKKLTLISNNSPLARVFHTQRKEDAICVGCHHRMEMTAAKKVPQCSSCHGRRFDPKQLGKPGILAAYHRQCMGCHEAMHQKPRALDCVKCHPAKDRQTTAKLSPTRGFVK